jgi:predicted nuclease of predicted toxin-antitoxin system
MKFLADMGISPGVVNELRRLGYDAIHLQERGWERLSDGAILQKAREEHRIVLTHDLDFGELMAVSGGNLPSVIIFRLTDMRPANVWRHLCVILEKHSLALEEGAVSSVGEHKVRIRSLPI